MQSNLEGRKLGGAVSYDTPFRVCTGFRNPRLIFLENEGKAWTSSDQPRMGNLCSYEWSCGVSLPSLRPLLSNQLFQSKIRKQIAFISIQN